MADHPNTAALLPCPHCGNAAAPRLWGGFLEDPSRDGTVVCDFHNGGCGAAVGWERTQSRAIQSWNRRAPVPSLPPVRLPEPPKPYVHITLKPHFGWLPRYVAHERPVDGSKAMVLLEDAIAYARSAVEDDRRGRGFSHEQLDAAIDAALAAQPEKG